MPTLKAVKADKLTAVPGVRHVRLRGVDYTITEIDVDQHDEAMKTAEDENGNVPFGKLLRAMVLMSVRPLPKGKSWPFPVYRTLEQIVNEMHYIDLPDETDEGKESEPDEDKEPDVPNA
jgi:hypothetical protein